MCSLRSFMVLTVREKLFCMPLDYTKNDKANRLHLRHTSHRLYQANHLPMGVISLIEISHPSVEIRACESDHIHIKRWAAIIHFSWWRHQMETFPTLPALCEGNPMVIGGFSNKGNASHAELLFLFSLMCPWTNGWTDSWDADDLRRHGTRYGVALMRLYLKGCKSISHPALSQLSGDPFSCLYLTMPIMLCISPPF